MNHISTSSCSQGFVEEPGKKSPAQVKGLTEEFHKRSAIPENVPGKQLQSMAEMTKS